MHPGTSGAASPVFCFYLGPNSVKQRDDTDGYKDKQNESEYLSFKKDDNKLLDWAGKNRWNVSETATSDINQLIEAGDFNVGTIASILRKEKAGWAQSVQAIELNAPKQPAIESFDQFDEYVHALAPSLLSLRTLNPTERSSGTSGLEEKLDSFLSSYSEQNEQKLGPLPVAGIALLSIALGAALPILFVGIFLLYKRRHDWLPMLNRGANQPLRNDGDQDSPRTELKNLLEKHKDEYGKRITSDDVRFRSFYESLQEIVKNWPPAMADDFSLDKEDYDMAMDITRKFTHIKFTDGTKIAEALTQIHQYLVDVNALLESYTGVEGGDEGPKEIIGRASKQLDPFKTQGENGDEKGLTVSELVAQHSQLSAAVDRCLQLVEPRDPRGNERETDYDPADKTERLEKHIHDLVKRPTTKRADLSVVKENLKIALDSQSEDVKELSVILLAKLEDFRKYHDSLDRDRLDQWTVKTVGHCAHFLNEERKIYLKCLKSIEGLDFERIDTFKLSPDKVQESIIKVIKYIEDLKAAKNLCESEHKNVAETETLVETLYECFEELSGTAAEREQTLRNIAEEYRTLKRERASIESTISPHEKGDDSLVTGISNIINKYTPLKYKFENLERHYVESRLMEEGDDPTEKAIRVAVDYKALKDDLARLEQATAGINRDSRRPIDMAIAALGFYEKDKANLDRVAEKFTPYVQRLETPFAAAARIADEFKTINDDIYAVSDALKGLGQLDEKPAKTVARLVSENERLSRQVGMIEQHFRRYARDSGETPVQVAARMAQEYEESLHELSLYFQIENGNLLRCVQAVGQLMRGINASLETAGLRGGNFADRLKKLLAHHKWLSEENRDRQALIKALGGYLNFQDLETMGVASALHLVEQEDPYKRRLRLGLSSALLAWREAVSDLMSNGSLQVINALKIKEIDREIETKLSGIIKKLQDESPDAFWREGIKPGFAYDWLHFLFRADLLLHTYFSGDAALLPLSDVLSIAAASLRAGMQGVKVKLEAPGLLSAVPTQSPEQIDIQYKPDDALRSIPEVVSRVRLSLDQRQTDFIVDIKNFRYQEANNYVGVCRVVGASPSEWRRV
ncbi:MAG TPA: hypothetical protein VF131_01715 [Blastocatellia bacterium]|nr:hypothetical protein [Blastocatellia bacterium]